MKLLILASRFPYPLEKGDKLRLFHQITYLSNYHEIILCCLHEEEPGEEAYQKLREVCEEVYVLKMGKLRSIWEMGKAVFSDLPFQVAYFYRKRFLTLTQEAIQKHSITHIYCQLLRMGEYARGLELPVILDYMDAFSLGMERRATKSSFWLKPLVKWEARKLKTYETNLFSAFNKHTIISKQDREALALLPDQKKQVSIVPNGIDLDFFSFQEKTEKQYDLVFVGNLGYYPNEQAARYLVKSLLPALTKELPEATLLLAGARPSSSIKQLNELAQVEVAGWVEDIRTAYQAGKVFVAPLFTGSGQQNKILEAMALGVPCVTTSIVNEAIGASDGKEILLAESISSFILQIRKLLENPAYYQQVAINARKFVEVNYSWELSGRRLLQAFD
ncbi:MAG: glycosyltransferase [Bacteroidota bacterium]